MMTQNIVLEPGNVHFCFGSCLVCHSRRHGTTIAIPDGHWPPGIQIAIFPSPVTTAALVVKKKAFNSFQQFQGELRG